MVNFNPTFTLIIIVGVIQVYTANPVFVKRENHVTKISITDELRRAKNNGITELELLEATSIGYTTDEWIKIYPLIRSYGPRYPYFEETIKLCEILVRQHKPARNYSNAQETRLNELLRSSQEIPRNLLALFLRTSVCAYVSEPFVHEMDASSFGLNLIPYMKFRFWKLKNQNAVGVERVATAKQICYIYNGGDDISKFKVPLASLSLSEEKMNNFATHWSEFEATKTSRSFSNVCDFLRSTDTTEEC